MIHVAMTRVISFNFIFFNSYSSARARRDEAFDALAFADLQVFGSKREVRHRYESQLIAQDNND